MYSGGGGGEYCPVLFQRNRVSFFTRNYSLSELKCLSNVVGPSFKRFSGSSLRTALVLLGLRQCFEMIFNML